MNGDEPGGAATIEFLEFMSRFPTGVAVVGTLDSAGQPVGMTCSALASVCVSPPTILICMGTRGVTLQATRSRSIFSVNLLSAGGRELAGRFAERSPNRFDSVSWRMSSNGTPWLDDAVAVADFKVQSSKEVGDHTVVFGVALEVVVYGGEPLLYGMRHFFVRHGAERSVQG
jgi:flavin reductase (NADH)